MKRHKTNFAILGLIMVFSVPIVWNIALISLINFNLQIYFYSIIAILILSFVGFIIISLSHSWTLAVGTVLLAFGISRIVAGVYYPPYSFNDPFISHYISHFRMVGYLFICIGIPLILASLFNRDKK